MKNTEKINDYKTKDVMESIQYEQNVFPNIYIELFDNFKELTVVQQQYVIETIKNIKKHNL